MIIFLWRNREKPKLLSRRWLIVMAKRFINAYGLLKIVYWRTYFFLKGVKVGKLSILYKFDINGPAFNLEVGDSSFVANKIHISTHDHVSIGSYVTINDGVTILTASHDVADPHWRMFKRPIVIQDYVWIATGATILPGVTIGYGAVVGAGAVVTKDVPPFAVATGNPAQIKLNRRCNTFEYDPVKFCAPYEAWIGRNAKLQKEHL